MAHHQTIRHGTATQRAVGTPLAPKDIPDKLYFRIGEVARLCDVPAYVLRFWESEFPQLKPNKGGTGQRLFRRRDVEMALRIKRLLYDEGYTIPGARQLLKGESRHKEPQLTLLAEDSSRSDGRDVHLLRSLREDLVGLLALLGADPALTPARANRSRAAGGRSPETTPALRRPSLAAIPAGETLFDFAGSSAAQIDRQEPEVESV